MNKIKFSHVYTKFPFGKTPPFGAELLQVFLTEKNELSEEFIKYDTRTDDGDYYELPEGKLLILLLRADIWRPKPGIEAWQKEVFTTVRRWTLEKEQYYKSKVGEVFEIVVV